MFASTFYFGYFHQVNCFVVSRTILIVTGIINHDQKNQLVFVNLADKHKFYHQLIIYGNRISYKVRGSILQELFVDYPPKIHQIYVF